MNRKSKLIVLACSLCIVGLVGMIIFQGCSLFDGADIIGGDNDGGLSLSVTDELFKPMIILPDGDYDTFTYQVVLDSQTTDDHFEQEVPAAQTSVEFNNLPSSIIYDVFVFGKNAAAEVITIGTSSVLIVANTTIEEEVIVDWLRDGTGHFIFDIAITPDVVYNPVLECEWYDGTTWGDIVPTDNLDGTFTIEGDYVPGFYGIAVRLYSDGDSYDLASGLASAVFVLKDMTSAGSIVFDEDNTNVSETGGALIVILEPIESPIFIGFIDPPDTVLIDEPFTLYTQADSPLSVYSWYRDGLLLAGEIGDTLTDTVTEPSVHYYSVFAYEGNITTSTSKLINFILSMGAATWNIPDIDTDISNPMPAVPFEVYVEDSEGNPYTGEIYFKLSPNCTIEVLDHCTVTYPTVVCDNGLASTTVSGNGWTFLNGNRICLEVHAKPDYSGFFSESTYSYWF